MKVAVADLDGDGQAEIIAAMASNGSQIEIYRSDGTLLRKFEAFENHTGLVVTAGQIVGDSRPEMIVSELNGTVIRLFGSTGQLLAQVPGADSSGIVSLAVGSEVVEMSVEQ